MVYETTQCKKYNHPELRFNIDEQSVPDVDAKWLVSHLEEEVGRGVKYQDGETIQMGWMLNKFQLQNDGYLHLLEPNMTDFPIVFTDNMTTTLKHLRQQKDTVESCELELEPLFPSLRQAIITSNNYPECNNFFMTREEPEEQMSGWFFRDTSNPDVEPTEDDFGVVSLYEFVCNRPDLAKFLAFPPGFGIHILEDGIIHIIKGQNQISIKPDSFLGQLNASRQ